ncbi:MAG TPA: hypothetical protein VFW00_06385 [Rhodocyclaceae bacterium]|nr:hypothetical protein [Rhodocyclaceae bacterium]
MSDESENLKQEEVIKAIAKAFARLKILPKMDLMLRAAILNIFSFAGTGPFVQLAQFRDASTNKTLAQLETIQKLAKKLADHIESLNSPAIDALADFDYEIHLTLPQQLKDVAQRAEKAHHLFKEEHKEPDTKIVLEGGRPENRKAMGICQILAHYYTGLTGESPVRAIDGMSDDSTPYTPYFVLAKEIFKALELEENSEHYARKVCELLKEKTSKKN